MAAVMTAPPTLAPRPSPRNIAAWSSPTQSLMHLKENNRPAALKQLQQTAPPRSRRERPCDGCRRRKSKCVLQEARRCVLCEFHKQECTFVENAQPRKRKLDDAAKSESPAKKSPATTQITPTPVTQQFSTQQTQRSPPPIPAQSAVHQMKAFSVDETLSLRRHHHCRYLGQTTALDAALIALGDFNERNESDSLLGTLRRVTDNEYFSTHADSDVHIPDDEARALAEIEHVVGPYGPALVDIYFRNVHPSFPIIQKVAFLDRHRHNDRQFNPPLLAAMYLLALNWWSSEPSLAIHPKPDMARLEYIAISSLTIAMQRPKMSAVQAGLLLLQRAKSSTWTLTVQLVALAQDIGLHLDCSNWSIPPWERRLRKRLAWALYMQDKWSSVMHGRPSHINPSDWNVSPPTMEDFDETIPPLLQGSDETDEHVLKCRTIFMQMISLTSIMSEVRETFYSQNAKAEYTRAGRFATQLVLNRAKPVQIKLKDWFSKLPPECKMDAYSPDHFSSTGYLHLAYFATEISIHRRIVQSLDPSTADPYMLYICRSAAKTRLISAMDFVNRLKPEHLNAFWYFASATNFALIGTFGALLQATSPAMEEADFYACRLSEFKWTLAVSARKAPWIQTALDLLDANSQMLMRLPQKPATEFQAVQRNHHQASMVDSVVQGIGQGKDEEGDEEDEDEDEEDDGDEDEEDGDEDDMEMEFDGW